MQNLIKIFGKLPHLFQIEISNICTAARTFNVTENMVQEKRKNEAKLGKTKIYYEKWKPQLDEIGK